MFKRTSWILLSLLVVASMLLAACGPQPAPTEAPVEEPVNGEWCLTAGNGYRSCPIYRKFLAELLH